MAKRPSRVTTRKTLLGTAAIVALAVLNAPAVAGFAQHAYRHYEINQPAYRAKYGHWALAALPDGYEPNSIHAILLRTGKVLLIAGSGNNVEHFNGGAFKSTLWDPATDAFKKIDTPADLFCSGHTQLPDGKILIAGGTARYEVLRGDVKRAGGAMLIKNENPDHPHIFPKGTVFRSPAGVEYRSQFPVRVPAAKKTPTGRGGNVTVTASQARVFVEAVEEGPLSITNTTEQYEIQGLKGTDANNLYGIANKLGLDKKDFQGIKDAYEFDPATEKYTKVGSMTEARWYPTLTTLSDGRVLAVSGLDDIGQVVPGKNEIYDPKTRTWSKAPTRYFPTYPSLFLTGKERVSYSGSNAGYGPADKGREPGLWNLGTNTFTPVTGLTDSDILETSSSVLLPPAQDRKVMVLGGGGVGESRAATSRTAIADLDAARPAFTPGPRLPANTRYLNSVIMPDDTVFTTGGSSRYRGKGASDLLTAQFYDPATNAFKPAADPTVGRNYHTEALLLPDGRVAVFGSDPLFADKADTRPGHFEQRVEVYSPPSLFHGTRPALTHGGSTEAERGKEVTFDSTDAARITHIRLMRPGSATHVTDFDQRSVALDLIRRTGRSLTVRIPDDPSLVPSGWYMTIATDGRGTPSKAVWLHIR
ncbi:MULTISPECIES: kelch motif-containing protein [unclassified Streptomyces]|uniref:kelch motif-containing protein n=1 Tax=unclassified Streptomyces TaxID=2593676 RepID=UPI002E2B0D30|nr:kelch motif-containing protein [Streptomyces sp. NBC_00228]WSW96350.1 kelch motif-containing protein [Streptomyces sp. NBC_00989]